MKYVLRIISAPLVFGVMFLFLLFRTIRVVFNWIKYGGEMNVYNEKLNQKTIADVYDLVKDK